MCGIAGVMMRGALAPDPDLLVRMRDAIAHRGPDGHHMLIRGNTGLLHLRLAIVDLVTGDQPLFGAAGEAGPALIANGEIYNNPELRRAMSATPFRTRSDCEPAIFLYEAEGPGFAARLRGMFAIAIHDPARGRLVLARDSFGIKPIYWAEAEDLFAFASEPQALLAAGLGRRAPDPDRAAELMQLKFTTGSATIYPGIHRVLPGETLVIEGGRIVSRHQAPALPDAPLRRQDTKALDAVLIDSVTAHLQSDVPYGLFLSGGIDSAALLALMTRATGGERVRALTVGWAGAEGVDETAEALRLAALQGADCVRLEMSAEDFWRFAPRIAACIDDPTADAAVLPSWMLGRAARAAGLKVTLCGEGGDELFGGYARYRKRRAPWRWLARKPRAGGVFGSAFSNPGIWRAGLARAEASVSPDLTALQQAQAIDCAEWLPNDLLVKLDRCLMVHGVEGRTPFLDPVVARFAFPLPDGQKAGLRFGKLLLREWLAEAFPAAGAWARKKGFKPPVGGWIAKRGLSLATQVAGQPGVAELFEPDFVRATLAEAEARSQQAWSLLYYALWHSHHVMGVPAEGDIGHVLAEAWRQR